MRHRKRIGLVGLIALLVALVTACQAKPPDRRADAQLFTNQMRAMPGVAAASDDVADSLAQGHGLLQCLRRRGKRSDRRSARRGNRPLICGSFERKYAGYRTELDVRRGWNVSPSTAGECRFTNRDQILQQARDWVALRREFPGATIRLRATIAHPGGQMPIQEYGHSNTATLTLNGGADYTAVAATVRSLSTGFPDLTAIDWTISAGKITPHRSRPRGGCPPPPRSACGPGSTPTSPSRISTGSGSMGLTRHRCGFQRKRHNPATSP